MKRIMGRFGVMAALCACIGLAACTAPPAASDTTDTVPAVEVPANVERAREAALDFLRVSANQCVPPEGTAWAISGGTDTALTGYEVYRFYAQDCNLAVTSASDPGEDALYHVTLGDGNSGLCWQAIIDETGHVLHTGRQAEEEPTLGHIAATFCEAQGGRYEVQTQENGTDCGMCVFGEEDACNAWAFFRGDCGDPDRASADG